MKITYRLNFPAGMLILRLQRITCYKSLHIKTIKTMLAVTLWIEINFI